MDLGSEAFALSEGLTNVTPKKISQKFKLLQKGIKYQESSIRKTKGGKCINANLVRLSLLAKVSLTLKPKKISQEI